MAHKTTELLICSICKNKSTYHQSLLTADDWPSCLFCSIPLELYVDRRTGKKRGPYKKSKPKKNTHRKPKPLGFKVFVILPVGVTDEIMADYIKSAVQGWKLGYDPGNPLRHLDTDSVTVKRLTPKYGEQL